jgi:tyrosyl-tRNA synthetase
MGNILDILTKRGFVDNTTHEEELNDYLNEGSKTCYIGFDPTASSLHIGSLVPIMSLAHMQRNGHRPIALVGGGTGLVGDPSGKTEMRKILTPDLVEENALALKKQLSLFIDFDDDKALLINNADWLTKLEYIPFLRDIGRHFSVNRMTKAESYKMRLESEEGLSFIEFNYMLLQSYDFLHLFNTYDCRLQMGGSDQWGNIVSGIELIRKVRRESAFGITFPLITTSGGAKMGKTAKGAVWLDENRTSAYDYFQYWINCDDKDVERFLSLYTFLPMAEIKTVSSLTDSDLNCSKAILAFETTQIVHGHANAVKAYEAASSMFGDRVIPSNILPSSTIPREAFSTSDVAVPYSFVDQDEIKAGIPAFKIFQVAGLAVSSGAARRLIQQGGAYINNQRIAMVDFMVTETDAKDGVILLRSGKKRFHKIMIKNSINV